MKKRTYIALVALLIAGLGVPAALAEEERQEPALVTVQHFLIAFKRSVPNKKIERSKKDAGVLAEQLFKRAQDGEDFDALVEEYTDDSPPGIYTLTNKDAPRVGGSVKRSGMVPGFGDVAFELEVGEIGMCKFSYRDSPYGWHIIKRLE